MVPSLMTRYGLPPIKYSCKMKSDHTGEIYLKCLIQVLITLVFLIKSQFSHNELKDGLYGSSP